MVCLPLPLNTPLLYIYKPLPKCMGDAALAAHHRQHVLHLCHLTIGLDLDLGPGFCNTHNAVALTPPPDVHGRDDDSHSADTEDLTEHAGCGHCKELGHHQGALSDVQIVEHWRQVQKCSHIWVVQK